MHLRLRQLCIVAADKAAAVAVLSAVLDLPVIHGSGDLSAFGLPAIGPMSAQGRALLDRQGVENLLFGVGSDVLEILFPLRSDATAERYRRRCGGDTGYMVILQSDNPAGFGTRSRAEGVRVVHEADFAAYRDIQLHAKDTGGALLSIARHCPDNVADGPWYPAGTAWETMPRSRLARAIVGATFQSDDPAALAARWSRLLHLTVRADDEDHLLDLEDGVLRFTRATDGRGERFAGIDFRVIDRDAVLAAASARGLTRADGSITLCGMHCRLVE